MTVTAQQYESNVERITSHELVVGYLRRLKDSHALLRVTVSGYNEICNTILVAISDDENFVVLDKLHPEPGHKAFMSEQECRVHAQHQGVDLGFVAKFEQLIGSEDSPAYRVTFPSELLYHQKRAAFRAPIGAGQEIEVMLTDEDKSVYSGKLHNISTGGLSVNLTRTIIEKLDIGDTMPACRFTTTTGVSFDLATEVRNIKIDEEKNIFRAGMRFVETSPQELRAIQRFVLALEREQIKRSR